MLPLALAALEDGLLQPRPRLIGHVETIMGCGGLDVWAILGDILTTPVRSRATVVEW